MKDLSLMSDQELVEYLKLCDTKALQYKIEQESLKVLANGLYGAFGSKYFRYFNVDCAEAVTLSGQTTIDAAQNFFNDLAAGLSNSVKDRIFTVDTDSCFLDVSDIVARIKDKMPGGGTEKEIVKFLDKLGETKFNETMEAGFAALQAKQNAYVNRLSMKREKIGKCITVAKKRYVAKVFVNEDVWYEEPDISITGLESARSDVPKWCRDKLADTYGMLFDLSETTVQKHIADVKSEFMKLPIEAIAIPKGVTDITKYMTPGNGYRSGTTQQAKAAIIYNRLVVNNKLSSKYTLIRSGDKIKLLPLKIPNPTRESIVGFLDKLPPEFGIEKYVDRNGIFEKAYLDPITRVLKSIGWTPKEVFSLDSDDFY